VSTAKTPRRQVRQTQRLGFKSIKNNVPFLNNSVPHPALVEKDRLEQNLAFEKFITLMLFLATWRLGGESLLLGF
jgi:hypothetical protein